MYDIKLRYLASVFLDADSITATAENIAHLVKAFNSSNLLPIGMQELAGASAIPRLAFASPEGDWQLRCSKNRFDLIHVPVSADGAKLGDFSLFCQEASSKLVTTLNYFQRKAHRLAAVQEGLLAEFPKEEMEEIPQRLFHLPSTFIQHAPFEWDWRAVGIVARTFGKVSEPTNTIAAVKRWRGMISRKLEGEIMQSQLDRIRVDFDINTLPENAVARFGESPIVDFFKEASAWHEQLSAELFAFISGRG